MEDKFLPIGTVVLLKDGKREIMITSYCIVPNGPVYDRNGKVEDGKQQIFDYGACFYPEGLLNSDQTFAFNHDQIEKICFMGYQTNQQKNLSDVLNSSISKMKEEISKMNQEG